MKTRPKKVKFNFSGVWDRFRMNWFLEGLTCQEKRKKCIKTSAWKEILFVLYVFKLNMFGWMSHPTYVVSLLPQAK